MTAIAIATGGGVRVGLEDNIWADRDRTRLATNPELVQRAADFARLHQREIMTPSEFRDVLGLSPSPSSGRPPS
jgi:uncharacterized protein (DUF849 family)